MNAQDPIIARIAQANPTPHGADLPPAALELAQRARRRVLASDRSARPIVDRRRRGFASVALAAASLIVVLVVGALTLAGHSSPPTHAPGGAALGPTPTVAQVATAMNHQPRIVQVRFGENGEPWGRIVLDSPAHFLAIYGNADNPAYSTYGLPRGRLTLISLDVGGHEYRRANSGCYRRYPASPLDLQSIIGSDLPSAPATGTGSSASVAYPGQEGERVTVDRQTRLVESVVDPGLPSGGVPATHTTYSYPSAVTLLAVPHLCG